MYIVEYYFILNHSTGIEVQFLQSFTNKPFFLYTAGFISNKIMNLFTFMKLGYAMLIVTLLLMFWTSMARMHELPVQYPPCFFNPLCTCSKAIPDLGIVSCYNVPMPRIPQPINSSKVFMLQLENNGLMFLQPQFLINTGLYKLQIKHNPLADIPDEAFLGLERSLWELELPYNRLFKVPSKSFRHLQKLRLLDLTGNKISHIAPENWRGLEDSLQILRLGRNSIDKLPADAFAGLSSLEILDLRENTLKEIDASVFRDGMAKLTHLYLNDNQLVYIPYAQLSSLKRMKVLDLSYNRISKMLHPLHEPELRGVQMSLDILRLDYNQIEMLMPTDFQHFYKVNKTYLNGNPLTIIESGAFRDSRIKELYFSDCNLIEVNSADFSGLESSLEVLDLSGNNITNLQSHLFQEYDFLRTLIFRENRIDTFSPVEVFNGFQYSLYNLDLSGKENSVISLQDLRQMRNLRFLSISKMPESTLVPENFLEFGMDIKELHIIQSNLNAIKNHAFTHVRGIKYLDFSENSISTIEDDAFSEVGHSLLTLRISHGLSSSITEIPNKPFKSLTNLQHLDFSNNKIKSMPDTAFHFLKRIKRIELQDNEIDAIPKGTFQGDIHSMLEEVNFAFNQIKSIQTHTFVDLLSLMTINLEDNAIQRIERRGFMNMNRLKYINLRGNKITDITDEAFQNLPDLEFLDLAYNDLNEFDLTSFDQVGTLSSFKVNVSHNEIPKLWINSTTFTSPTTIGGNMQANIKVLDLSYNNISDIMKYYFKPVEYSLSHLYMSHNQLTNVTQGIFGNMPHLQWLDLSHNDLIEVDFDCFRNTRNLQVLFLSWNNIADIPADALRPLKKLRIVDLSHNRLRSLPDNMFTDAIIESLDLSHNQFMRLPVKTMSISAAMSLSILDLSWNTLSGIHTTDAIFRLRVPELPLTRLQILHLAHNELASIPAEMASNLTSLHYLDLSYNDLTVVPLITHTLPELKTFNLANNPITAITNTSFLGVADSLEELDIRWLSLSTFEAGALCKATKLRRLYITAYTGLKQFNFPNILEYNHGLRDLLIDVENETDLQKEMKGKFPCKLYNITLTGKALKIIHSDILKGIRNSHLHFGLFNTSVNSVPKEIFINAEWVRNITVDLHRTDTRTLHNPSTGHKPGVPRKQFLMKLRLAGSYMNCDCDIGWIEMWQRKHRQYQEDRCNSYGEFNNFEREEGDEFNCWDNGSDDDLRETFCMNKNNMTLSKALKTEIECGWSSGNNIGTSNLFIFFLFLITGIQL
ncbi:PREDICTED: chaoptin-like isoform X2 [Polistes dominula]|uniref:Chaoptin-like isoform X2 n=1 Tax=Polistes dominula TaxID=743375 RepID=A0ABM1ID89_POLDO|nr:PREDICTED: chaoptin-like isoform X2 [Polistes dominula]